MNGPHDLGGQYGFGRINPEPEISELVFHHDWERKVFAITLACGFLGKWNIDEARHARERQHPVKYLSNTYYQNWLAGLEKLLVEKNLITEKELNTGHPYKEQMVYTPPDVHEAMNILTKGSPANLQTKKLPKFKKYDRVKAINNHSKGHTRLPRYVRGCSGTVIRSYGVHIFPDDNAKGIKNGEHLYSVCFKAKELWSENNKELNSVCIDLWEPYMAKE